MTLLDGKMDPITSEFGFVRAPCEVVAAWLAEREASLVSKRCGSVSSMRLSGSLEATLRSLLPLTSVERRRTLLLTTSSDWTAVFDNGWQGGDASGLSYAASMLDCLAVRIVNVPDVKSGGVVRRYGARVFEMYGPDQTDFLNYIRTISVVNDGGRWRMDQSGKALSCESPAWFEARLVRDRFQEDDLTAILRSIGILAFDAGFYGNDGFIVERRGPTTPGCREYTLDEVQKSWI